MPAEPESSDEEQDCRDGSEDELYVLRQTNTDSESTTSNSYNGQRIVHLLNVVVKINSSLFKQRSASHSLKNKEDSTDRLILHGTEIFNGSPFVHHSNKCSAFIVEEQQLKVCYHLYLESIVH